MFDVGAVAAVAEDHPAGVDAFLVAEHPLDGQPRLTARMGVDGDGHPRLVVGLSHGAHDSGDPIGHALMVDGALEKWRFDPGPRDAVLDVGHEKIHHGVWHVNSDDRGQRRPAVVEEPGHVVVRVAAGGYQDVKFGDLFGDALYTGDV